MELTPIIAEELEGQLSTPLNTPLTPHTETPARRGSASRSRPRWLSRSARRDDLFAVAEVDLVALTRAKAGVAIGCGRAVLRPGLPFGVIANTTAFLKVERAKTVFAAIRAAISNLSK
ncbi:hypothetical protein [Roseovarius mucosus]|uniref:hypothetical protein n=1 Tax=Roseovarius mucosus TaxID=215743 RepID=UPI0035CF5AC3|tara:strand:- start:662 stop:1015 length:354 start_codon:yes stop_codon:yes gene_type:complete